MAVFGDDVTTDHISPAGAIPPGSDAARHLADCGVAPASLGNYAARRGNFEVMVRGTFTNRTLVNLLTPELPPGQTRMEAGGRAQSFTDAATQIAADSDGAAVISGARYGQGSSRDWGAKGPTLLGVRAILAQSFERIHRSNLIGMGILPILAAPEWAPGALTFAVGDVIQIDVPSDLSTKTILPILLYRADGTVLRSEGRLDCQTEREIAVLRMGGMIADLVEATTAATQARNKMDLQI